MHLPNTQPRRALVVGLLCVISAPGLLVLSLAAMGAVGAVVGTFVSLGVVTMLLSQVQVPPQPGPIDGEDPRPLLRRPA